MARFQKTLRCFQHCCVLYFSVDSVIQFSSGVRRVFFLSLKVILDRDTKIRSLSIGYFGVDSFGPRNSEYLDVPGSAGKRLGSVGYKYTPFISRLYNRYNPFTNQLLTSLGHPSTDLSPPFCRHRRESGESGLTMQHAFPEVRLTQISITKKDYPVGEVS